MKLKGKSRKQLEKKLRNIDPKCAKAGWIRHLLNGPKRKTR